MPTYEYVCKSCGHLFEIVQSMHDDPLTECPECGGELRKVFAPPAISFRGSGFYATDHGKKAPKKEGEKGEKKSASETGGKKDSKGDGTAGGSKKEKESSSSSSSSSKDSSSSDGSSS